MTHRAFVAALAGLAALLSLAAPAAAQPAGAPVVAPAWAQPPLPPGASAGGGSGYRSRSASSFESGTLYLTSAAYGIGLGVWLDAELGISDPGILLIPPTLLGVAAPVGAFFLNRPRLPRGVPGAVAAGLVIGAGEGLGIAGVQMVTSDDPWGFRGMSRATAVGATLGGIGGYALGVVQEPSPNISAFATSGVAWGSLIGAAVGLGASEEGIGFRRSDDWMARGGLIGFNAGLLVTMGLSTAFVPTLDQLTWMWFGAGIGAAVSLPVYLFYIGDDAPPAKRGLLFSATATTLGIVAGGVFGPELGGLGLSDQGSAWASVDYVAPMPLRGGIGLQLGGSLF